MKILHITQRYAPAHGGSEMYIQIISEHFAKENEVEVWTSNAYELDSFWDLKRKTINSDNEVVNSVLVRRFSTSPSILKNPLIHKVWNSLLWRVHSMHIPIWSLRCIGSYPMVFGMLRYALSKKKWDFDVIQVTASPYNILFYIALIVAKRSQAKLLISPFIHLGESEEDPSTFIYLRPETVEFYKRADVVLYQTEAEKDAIKKLCFKNKYRVSEKKFVKLGMGIFPEKVKGGNASRFRKKYKIKEPIVFYIGPRTRAKGVFNLVHACVSLWEKGQAFKLVLAGMNMREFDDFWKEMDRKYKKNILILDCPPEQDKLDLLAAGDVFSMVSKSDSFGIVYLESWYCKKPVLGCNLKSISEVIHNKKDGLLCEFEDIDQIANSIKYLLENPDVRKKFGEYGHNKVMNNYTWERKFKILDKLYKN